ncbi:AraC family transcriptional regulator [Wenxinia saemankumensis]|uniref:Transcriptional regulator, AraC family n=1 Tax=Wenxinia saemankumensis TaxID=1447782 RepID=A0A1M6A0N6_9RHOB|nr:AraC family transcriptional regulator [Wenxinia saemankumensis]SHI29889.1 transcriptional regulator, AraC family [Wenxinia saemankumensis]
MTMTTSLAGGDRLSLQPIALTSGLGRWRTEAMRAHRTPRLMFVTKGQGRLTMAGLTRGYGANNLVFLPAGTMYGYEAGPLVSGHLLTIPGAMAAEWPDEPVHLRLRDVMAQREVAAIFDALERELKDARPGAARAAHYHLGLLGVYFHRQYDALAETARGEREDSAAARLVAAYSDLVEREFRRQPAIAHFARTLGVTPTHLTRACRQTCGRSAHELLTDRLLFEAREMLRVDPRPVKEVAAALGYNSPAYFTRAFQRATGQTPSDFRRASRLQGAGPRPVTLH